MLAHGYTPNSNWGGCMAALRPHDRTRGTNVIAMEWTGKAMIVSITALGYPDRHVEHLFGGREFWSGEVLQRAALRARGGAKRLSRSDNGRLSTPWQEVIFLLTDMDSIFEPWSPALG